MANGPTFVGGAHVHQAWARLMSILSVKTADALRRQKLARARMRRVVK